MNNEELHQFANDFRRLRADLIDRSNQILSMVEMALKRSTVVPTSSEHFSYLDYGIRITEGDYALHTESSQQLPNIALFAELDKRPMARSLGPSQAASLNEAGMPMLGSKSRKLLEPLKRSLTASQKLFVRNTPGVSQANDQPKSAALSAFAALNLSYASQESLTALSPLASPPTSEFRRKSSLRRSISLKDAPGVIYPPHASPYQKRVVMVVLLWLIPFTAAYNPTYNLYDLNFLAISISSIFLCDSLVALVTPQLVPSDISFFDLSEYEKARPTLPEKLSSRSSIADTIPRVLPKSDARRISCIYYLIRCIKLWRNFFQCPGIIRAGWRLDDFIGVSISRTLPLTGAIFWFIHCNACTIYMMGSLTGFVGWSSMWPLVDSATLFETYVWTYYKAVGNMFPTSFNPWSPAEQIASFIHVIFAAVVVTQYAIFLGAISSAVMAMNPSGRLFEQKVGELRDYIRSRDLSKETETRLLTCVLKRSTGDGRHELFMGRIAAALRSINYIPGDYVTKQGDSGSDMYFILNGKAEVYVNERHAVTLGTGKRLSRGGSHYETLRTATVQTVLPSLMHRLTYLEFHKILDDFADMRIRIDMLAEEREKSMVTQ
ncbi:hypothetical protein BJ741DRAFT_666826 [Chytriomyces cf. hyalinus JEL632]|nr:hypothetical protein BJ741DRAFT_666826 [Chytriomyces cf. hyalinus JEL632]